MKTIEQDAVVKQLLIESISAENLLLEKYDTYSSLIKDDEFEDLLKEFSKSAQEHIDLLKDKMQRLSML